jgi:hypothetical protein
MCALLNFWLRGILTPTVSIVIAKLWGAAAQAVDFTGETAQYRHGRRCPAGSQNRGPVATAGIAWGLKIQLDEAGPEDFEGVTAVSRWFYPEATVAKLHLPRENATLLNANRGAFAVEPI